MGWRALNVSWLLTALLAFPSFAWGEAKNDTLKGRGDAGPYMLSSGVILIGSESVRIPRKSEGKGDSLLVRDREYVLDFERGEIYFAGKLEASRRAVVSYEVLPFTMNRTYTHFRVREDTAQALIAVSDSQAKAPGAENPAEFRFGGSKTFGLSVGTQQDLSLEQSLRLSLSGQVTPGVEMEGLLSDENLPIQPEGTTERLEEIDKVSLAVRGNRGQALVGDYDFALKDGVWTALERRLTGARADLNFKPGTLTLAYAVPKGRFAENRFSGTEGKQGPYPLTSETGRREIVILGGTEKVWLDGELLRRGENNDYTIDYTNGELFFTPKRLITGQSRIAADFEYTNDLYRRNFVGGRQTLLGLRDRLSLVLTGLREEDERERPLSFALSDSTREALRAAGTDPQKAVISGASYVGPGNGDYIRTDSIFTYSGRPRGDYQVSFSRVGPGKGEYRYDGTLGGYVFVGNGAGEYTPRTFLPLPERMELLGASLGYKVKDAGGASFEFAASRRDRNTFTDLPGHVSRGEAFRGSWEWTPKGMNFAGKGLGDLEFRGRGNWVAPEFSSFYQQRSLDHGYQWNLDQGLGLGQKDAEASLVYKPRPHWSLTGEAGRLSRTDGRWALRRSGGLELSGNTMAKAQAELVRSADTLSSSPDSLNERRRERQFYSLGRKIRWLTPKASYAHERWSGYGAGLLREGYEYEEPGGGLGYHLGPKTGGGLTGELTGGLRKDRVYEPGGWVLDSRTRTYGGTAGFSSTGGFSTNLSYTRRKKVMEPGRVGSGVITELGKALLDYSPSKGALTSNTSYEFTNTATALKSEQFYQVTEGQGDWRRDPATGRYYRSPGGDWLRVLLDQGGESPVTTLKASQRLILLGRGSGLSAISSDVFASVEEESRESDRLKVYLLNPGTFQRDEATVFGRTFLEARVSFSQKREQVQGEWVYRIRRSDEEDNRVEGRHAERFEIEHEGTYRVAATERTTFELVGDQSLSRNGSTEIGIENKILDRSVRAGWVHRPSLPWEIRLSPGAVWTWVEEPAFYSYLGKMELFALQVRPGLRRTFKTQGQFELSGVLTRRTTKTSKELLPADVITERPVGFSGDFSLGGEMKLNEYITGRVSYSGRTREGARPQVLARAEVRAYF
jgi:hypothetical protein